jgi:hypothetical protein
MKEIFLSDRINRIPRIFSFFLSFLKEAEKTPTSLFLSGKAKINYPVNPVNPV